MSTALRLIRHELRSYNRMTKALSQSNVCDTKALLQEIEVQSFIEETLYKDLRNNLEDPLDVEFGGVLEGFHGVTEALYACLLYHTSFTIQEISTAHTNVRLRGHGCTLCV